MPLAELPRIGVRLPQELRPARAIELAVAAEGNGFSALWFAENPFHRGILPVVTACALKTERIGLGIGIVNCYQHHPTLIAMEFAALDELAPGRTVLGIGSGVGARIERLGFVHRPLASVADTIHIVRALFRGEELTYQGRVFSVDRVALHFRPPSPGMPIYLASMGDRSLALCGQLADGLIISNMCPLGYSARAVTIVQGSAEASGRPPLAVVQYVPCAIRPDGEEARQVALGQQPAVAGQTPLTHKIGRFAQCSQQSPGRAGIKRIARHSFLQMDHCFGVFFRMGQCQAQAGPAERQVRPRQGRLVEIGQFLGGICQ